MTTTPTPDPMIERLNSLLAITDPTERLPGLVALATEAVNALQREGGIIDHNATVAMRFDALLRVLTDLFANTMPGFNLMHHVDTAYYEIVVRFTVQAQSNIRKQRLTDGIALGGQR